MSIPRRTDPEERVQIECACGSIWTQSFRHYDKVLCNCGKPWWMLRPRRAGPLVAFPWPGTPEMLRYQQQQQPLAA